MSDYQMYDTMENDDMAKKLALYIKSTIEIAESILTIYREAICAYLTYINAQNNTQKRRYASKQYR